MDQMGIAITEKNREQTKILQKDWLSFIKTGTIPWRARFDKSGLITCYDDEITSVPFPLAGLINAVDSAGLYRAARESYLDTM